MQEGKTVAARESKHVVILHRFYLVEKSVAQLENFCAEVDSGSPAPPSETAKDVAAVPSLLAFLSGFPDDVDRLRERLDNLLNQLQEMLF
jgi:hypothetical protein